VTHSAPLIGLFGGTFDPVHYGHLRTAIEASEYLDLDQLRFMPCGRPPHAKAPGATPEQRLTMLKLALSGARTPDILIDETEIRAIDQLSYSYLTLTTLKRQEPNAIWVLLLGGDAFAGFDQWYRWREILELCHLGILTRPGFDTASQETMKRRLKARDTSSDLNQLRTHSHGLMVDVPVTPLTLSSSEIRRRTQTGLNPQFLTPTAVLDFIESEKLYRSQ
jgi:nicotinate-nucleotide adenylyltransferase